MALNRIWTPSGNYSGGSTKRLLVIHTMEGFTGTNGAYDCAKYFQGNVGASSQVCIDNNRGTIWECVARQNGAWTQCNYNSVSVSMEQSGYASWSRDYWLSNRSNQLHNVADWIAEESSKLGIPITRLTASQAQGSGKGVCGHSDLGSVGCGHSDPGSSWPWDDVLNWARGGSTTPPQPITTEEEDMPEIPPGSDPNKNPDVGWSFPVFYTQAGFFADVGAFSSTDKVKIRVALHNKNGSWYVQQVELTKTAPKKVISFSADFDGVSFRRQDDMPITVIPNFK